MNQRQLVFEYLLAGNTITSMEAFEKFGITRLSAVIFDLKKMYRGQYNITSTMEESTNRYGTTVRYSRYKLVPVEGNNG